MKETNLIKTAIKEIKGLEKETMIYLFGLSIVCFFLDVFLIRYLIHNVYILNLYRSIYIVVGFLSHVYLLNRFFKNKRIKTELKDKENIIIDSLRHLNGTPHELMYKLSNGELNIDINTDDEIDAAFALCKVFDFLTIQNGKLFVKQNMLEIIKKAYHRC